MQSNDNIPHTKKFSKSDLAKSDPTSRQTAIDFLCQRNFILEIPLSEQKEMYKKWDFIIHFNNKPVAVETEQKLVWKTSDGTFPYSTIDVPTRKNKSEAHVYIMFNKDFSVLAMTEMEQVLSSSIITKATKRSNGEYLTKGEQFFSVPICLFKFYKKNEEGKWNKV